MNVSTNPPLPSTVGPEPMTVSLLGTRLVIIDYDELLAMLPDLARRPTPTAIEFCNTHVVAMRRVDPAFIEATTAYDYFMPDGMPLIWSLRVMGVPIRDRVYGPTFMRHVLSHETKLRHYFLGGSEITSRKLLEQSQILSGGRFQVVGANHRYYQPSDSAAILEEINRLAPDIIWVGLGTPKQQQWIHDNKHLINRGVLMTVGFAFDINAGTKRDAPMWMQNMGLTWIFRISQEPSRLLGRYLKYNTWFIILIGVDLFHFFLKSLKQGFTRPFS
ncbi:WecB/TagA/CpsF family glycosyltransferase [Methylacidiphilales bacterium]|nr:WecB/TagA/CpsF family glycosyltransferase [Candidatus Methylacidiphilales bacterium]